MSPFAPDEEYADQIGSKGPKILPINTAGYLGQDERTLFTGVSVYTGRPAKFTLSIITRSARRLACEMPLALDTELLLLWHRGKIARRFLLRAVTSADRGKLIFITVEATDIDFNFVVMNINTRGGVAVDTSAFMPKRAESLKKRKKWRTKLHSRKNSCENVNWTSIERTSQTLKQLQFAPLNGIVRN